jgi:hypothetical protein
MRASVTVLGVVVLAGLVLGPLGTPAPAQRPGAGAAATAAQAARAAQAAKAAQAATVARSALAARAAFTPAMLAGTATRNTFLATHPPIPMFRGGGGLFSPAVHNAHPSIWPVFPNPPPSFPNGPSFGQMAYNTAHMGRPFGHVPPYLFGATPFGLGFPGVGLGGLGFPGLGFPGFGLGGLGGLGPYASLATPGGLGGLGGLGGMGGLGPYASLAAEGLGGLGGLGALGGMGGYGMEGMGYGMMNAAFANPYYGYLKGIADVTSANAQYWKTIEEGRLLREQSYRSGLETRRKIIEEANWERADWLKRTDPEANRQHEQEVSLERARHDPPLTEVLSGRALNDLSRQQGRGERGPNVPLDADLLHGINLTGQDTRANPGLLKEDGKLQWPLPLTGLEFKDSREQMDKMIADAVNLVKFNNPVDPGKIKDMRAELARLNETLVNEVSDLSPTDYIEAHRYLNLLADAIRALEDPKASNYFNQNWVAKGKNVAELIKYMSEHGLRFAPAVPGDEDAYRALYHALQAFDYGMTTVASKSNREG